MITPDEIVAKAGRIYLRAVTAELSGEESLFPYRIASNLKLPSSQSELIRQVQQLEDQSKIRLGYGYTVQRKVRCSRSHGENSFPDSIIVESMEDLVRMLRKTSEYTRLTFAARTLEQRLPELKKWIPRNWKRLIPIAAEIEDLIQVAEWLRAHPRPDCFPRELPLPVSTKLIESNWPLLASWLDNLLPDSAIDFGCGALNYHQRYGFRWVQLHIPVRLLDKSLKDRLSVPFGEFSLPLFEFQRFDWAIQQIRRVVIVENKINWLTFPTMPDTIAIGGIGNAITALSSCHWLESAEMFYWGDLDIEGFQILGRMRRTFPTITSLLMDMATLEEFLALAIPGNAAESPMPSGLTESEALAYDYCQVHNIRLEQERIHQSSVVAAVHRW